MAIKHYTKYKGHEPIICGKKKLYDGNIYTFDIETTSYIIVNGKDIYPASKYLYLLDKYGREAIEFGSTMYIWQLGINDQVYYGRTYEELFDFLDKIDRAVNGLFKIFWVHNLSFEFQFIYKELYFTKVFARKKRKPMFAFDEAFNIEFRCSLMLSDCSLNYLTDMYNLPIQKLTGDLDYDKLRHSKTKLTAKEKKYCEYDCLVLYEYIKKELLEYGTLKNIPRTSTGKVRKELKDIIKEDWEYKNRIRRMVDTDPIVFNMLTEAFAGGYAHANWIYVDEILKFLDSFDACSQYPFWLCVGGYPAKAFTKCNVKRKEDMLNNFCYIMRIRFKNGDSIYNNHFISASKCRNIEGAAYDNGRLAAFKSIETTITELDFDIIMKAYKDAKDPDKDMEYEILEIYKSPKRYLPKTYIKFILDKYVAKTKLKNVVGKETEYNKEKRGFNSIYGMTCTNVVRDEVEFKNRRWLDDRPLTNDEIVEKLNDMVKKPFLSFSTGVWCTAHSRHALMTLIMANDDYNVYSDTDSIKLTQGYNELPILEYNKEVLKLIDNVCTYYDLDKNLFSPEDIKGKKHTMGLFEFEEQYYEFITCGAKKYAVRDENGNIHITVAGVPKKSGSKCLDSLEEFEDGFIFDSKTTNKKAAVYNDEQKPIVLTDYRGVSLEVKDKTGVCLIPSDYTMGKSSDFNTWLSSQRAIYKEG